ncbi:YbhB/YbcL family Raf kinase inhibitor-like protein [Saccharomonospora xinjiangensis]|uniref:YbhB/YbcL family Raf kinase inhibitor-like protein n=1 Tax=Saccharomonospora xinjiangensis TaxID=75294 RepID=UPI00106FFBFD|nr:YbhB/YbcL family Raf kinase inhibitor-like protein [Saccharomonospora xinjiangensis]QBQ60268.1 putative kinase inhibitor protein [Saccharomonospora xinjiangensis]
MTGADRAAGPQGARGTSRGDPTIDEPPRALSDGLELRSPAFNDGTLIPSRYSHQGGNQIPPLQWTHVPEDTEELVLLCEDPDAPGGTFTHWVVAAIPPDVTEIEDAAPGSAVQGRNGFGDLGWGGPQPPVGDGAHRYYFRLYAVDRPLGLGEGATAGDVHAAVADHVLATGTLVGLFAR